MMNLFGSDEYSIPEDVAVDEETINDYKGTAVQGKLSAGRFGGLEWSVTTDREYDVEKGCMPPANKINTELRKAINSNAEEDLERSVFYNMGAAVGLHGEELTEDKPGNPDYDAICRQLYRDAEQDSEDGYWGQEVKRTYRNRSPVLRDSLTESAKNISDIMEELK